MDETKPMILLGIDTPHVVDHKTLSNIIMGLSYSMYLVLLEANGRRSIFFKKKLNISMSLKLVLASQDVAEHWCMQWRPKWLISWLTVFPMLS